MSVRVLSSIGAGLTLVLACSCGSGSPAEPSALERVSGVWVGRSTLSSVSGGECVGTMLRERIGSRDMFAAPMVQSDDHVEATVTYQGNKTACAYSGGAQGTNIQLTLTSCRVDEVRSMQCGGGESREIRLVSSRITARADNGTGNGNDTTTWNVLLPGTTTSVGTLSLTATFTWNELTLPSSDFHIFDGSVRPGYVDGTTVIPADSEPFCLDCGWF
jgi:hypothetical protein